MVMRYYVDNVSCSPKRSVKPLAKNIGVGCREVQILQLTPFFNGGACSKAGEVPLQGNWDGFDSHRLHFN